MVRVRQGIHVGCGTRLGFSFILYTVIGVPISLLYYVGISRAIFDRENDTGIPLNPIQDYFLAQPPTTNVQKAMAA
jgi:hypothetical protein